ncbi:hypothetical protein GCM10011273_32610 [Asticcacaulis endophyticus]|uniref:Uncharacterized protein n=1 Tax=Asticcacaulis endophyticus TaxID=1395890 RepID=A0A918UY50_9CAUL|nr:hypothetical protein GCM10011273_32610 [Asticcacaulis endophyticus]
MAASGVKLITKLVPSAQVYGIPSADGAPKGGGGGGGGADGMVAQADKVITAVDAAKMRIMSLPFFLRSFDDLCGLPYVL